jgi:hypothetical protein
MKLLQMRSWEDWRPHYGRLLLTGWIVLMGGAFCAVAAAETIITSYTLEKLTTHGFEGLVLKGIALPNREEYRLFLAYMIVCSAFVGTMAGILSRLALPHWRPWILAVVLTGLPCVIGALLAIFWESEAPQLFAWGVRHIVILSSVQAIASLLGALLGRPLGNLLVRALVPPVWRTRLGFSTPAAAAPPRPARPHYWTERVGRTR